MTDDVPEFRRVVPVRYLLVVGGVAAAFLLAFLVAAAFRVPLLSDPLPWMSGPTPAAAATGVGLLVVDVVLPVPSSVVMVAHGALFGVVVGASLSLAGALGASLAGYALGRSAGSRLLDRACPRAERERAARFVRRWGLLAVLVTRPVPLLAETVAVVAGAERVGAWRTAAASLLGALPAVVLYAAAGALSVGGPGGAVVLALAILLAASTWSLGRRWMDRTPADGRGTTGPPAP